MADLITTEFPNAATLAAALADAGVFASTDDSLPIINCVHLAVTGGTLTATATDRYCLIERNTPTAEDDESVWTALVPLADIKAIVALLKRYKNDLASLEWSADAVAVHCAGNTYIAATAPVDDFPNIDKLWPTTEPVNEWPWLNTALVGKLGKLSIAKDAEWAPVLLTCYGKHKPVMFTHRDNILRGLVMPVDTRDEAGASL